jgi:hypothetical protein
MYQQLPEFVRRQAKAYWFITTAQAGGGIAAFLFLASVNLVWLAPAGAVLGVIVLTRRQGVYNYEKLLAGVLWLWLQVRQEDALDQAVLYRTATPLVEDSVAVRRPGGGPTVAVRPARR